eukprot:COSAG01_NODE_7263_length_3277_cov_6.894588_1_plen_35_part_10
MPLHGRCLAACRLAMGGPTAMPCRLPMGVAHHPRI